MKTTDGSIVYYLDGKMHNFDGPAYIPQGNKRAAEYYLFGVKYTKEQWESLKRMVMVFRFIKQQWVKLQALEYSQNKDLTFIV